MAMIPADLMGWVPQAVGVSAILGFLVLGFAKSFIWTRPQVEALVERFNAHLASTQSSADGRVADARQREQEWREIAEKTLETNAKLADQVETLIEAQRQLQSMIPGSRDSRRRGGQ